MGETVTMAGGGRQPCELCGGSGRLGVFDGWQTTHVHACEFCAGTGVWTADLERVLNEHQARSTALAELVALQALKDAEGKTEEYERRQPLAWAAARRALGMPEGDDDAADD